MSTDEFKNSAIKERFSAVAPFIRNISVSISVHPCPICGKKSFSDFTITKAQIGIIKGTVVELQGQPLTTDDSSGPLTPYTTPQAPAPSGVPTG